MSAIARCIIIITWLSIVGFKTCHLQNFICKKFPKDICIIENFIPQNFLALCTLNDLNLTPVNFKHSQTNKHWKYTLELCITSKHLLKLENGMVSIYRILQIWLKNQIPICYTWIFINAHRANWSRPDMAK